jgi:EpsI family protein
MKRSVVPVAVTTLILAATLLASLAAENRMPHPLARSLDQIPAQIDGWTAVPGRIPDARELELLGATSYLSRDYRRAGQSLNLFVSYYAIQRAGESMHTPKNCLPAAGWEILKYDKVDIPFGARPQQVNKFTIQNGDAKQTVLYWYQSKDRVIASEYEGKGFLLWDAMTKGRTDGAVVRIIVPDNAEAANAALGFARAILPEMKLSFGS